MRRFNYVFAGLGILAIIAAMTGPVVAAPLTWDADSGTSGAQDGGGTWVTGGGGNWWNGASDVNWTNGSQAVFGAGSGAAGTVTVSGTVGVSSPTAGTPVMQFNAPGSGNYLLTGGTINITLATSNTAFRLLGGDVEVDSAITATATDFLKDGPGTLTLGGAVNNTGHGTYVGYGAYTAGAPNAGTLKLASGSSLTTMTALIGVGGGVSAPTNGTLTMLAGSTLTMTANTGAPVPLTVGTGVGGTGTFDFEGGTLAFATTQTGDGVDVGQAGGTGTWYIRGTVPAYGSGGPNTVWLGVSASGTTASSGTGLMDQNVSVNFGYALGVNYHSTANSSFTQSNGTLTVGSLWAGVGNSATCGTGTASFSGGTTTLAGWSGDSGRLGSGSYGKGVVTISGTAHVTAVVGWYVGYDATSTGTVNLNGGTLTTSALVQRNGSGTVNFNGGLLQACTVSSTTFITSGMTAVVQSPGGAKIDTNGYNDTIPAALIHDSGGPAQDGGLTKSGNGTLTLSSGANTYTGATTVNQGTLQVGVANALPASSPLILNGGTLATGAFSQAMTSTLTLQDTSAIDLGSGTNTSVLSFGNSSGATWIAGKTLTVKDWDGLLTGGGPERLKFGTSALALTGSELGEIQFLNPLGLAAGTYVRKSSARARSCRYRSLARWSSWPPGCWGCWPTLGGGGSNGRSCFNRGATALVLSPPVEAPAATNPVGTVSWNYVTIWQSVDRRGRFNVETHVYEIYPA